MKCEICLDSQDKQVSMHCAKYKVCFKCINILINSRMHLLGRNK